jgi:hypothetical protein
VEEGYVQVAGGEYRVESAEEWRTPHNSWLEIEAMEEEVKEGVNVCQCPRGGRRG